MPKIVLPKPSWQEGMVLFMMVYNFIPDDFETWCITMWDELYRLAEVKIQTPRI